MKSNSIWAVRESIWIIVSLDKKKPFNFLLFRTNWGFDHNFQKELNLDRWSSRLCSPLALPWPCTGLWCPSGLKKIPRHFTILCCQSKLMDYLWWCLLLRELPGFLDSFNLLFWVFSIVSFSPWLNTNCEIYFERNKESRQKWYMTENKL